MVQYFDDGDLACYNGYSFRRDKKTGYYLSTKRIGEHRKRLHVYVWESINGEIPKGYHVHHKDENKRNNELDNLELITAHEHLSLHSKERADWARQNLINNAIPAAVEWHKSKAGREWHSEHAKQQAQSWEYRTYICSYCGKEYQSRMIQANIPNHFCSNNCKSAYRRKMGFDDVTKICSICGGEYVANKYQNTSKCPACRHIKNRARRP